MKYLIKLLIVFLSISAFVACQDEDFTEPSDTSTGTASEEANYTDGDYVGLPEIMVDGEIYSDFDFSTSHSQTSWLDSGSDGTEIGLEPVASGSGSLTRLNMLGDDSEDDPYNTGPFTLSVPAVTPGDGDSRVEASISVPAGTTDAAYQISRAYIGDFDGDGEDDTAAYAVIVIPAVNSTSANVIGALLLGANAPGNSAGDGENPEDVDLAGTYFGNTYFDAGGGSLHPDQNAAGGIGSSLANTAGVLIVRNLELSGTDDSASDARTDSGFSGQVVPLGILNTTIAATIPATLNTLAGLGGGTAADGTLIGNEIVNAANYTNTMTISDDAFDLMDGSAAMTHDIVVEFSHDGSGLFTIDIVITDENGETATIQSVDQRKATIPLGAVTNLVLSDGGDTALSTNALRQGCGGESAGAAFEVDPLLFSQQNVFGNSDVVCSIPSAPAVHLSDGTPLGLKLTDASANGYAITLGYVVAAAVADESDFVTVLNDNVDTSDNYNSLTMSDLVIKAYTE